MVPDRDNEPPVATVAAAALLVGQRQVLRVLRLINGRRNGASMWQGLVVLVVVAVSAIVSWVSDDEVLTATVTSGAFLVVLGMVLADWRQRRKRRA